MDVADSAPDSWDCSADGAGAEPDQTGQLKTQLANLNVHASSFVPGQNIYASNFIPSWVPKEDAGPPATVDAAVVLTHTKTTEAVPADSAVSMGLVQAECDQSPTANLVHPSAGESGDCTDPGPSDLVEENFEDEIDAEMRAEQVKTKKKPVETKATDKKEHVNIVFIGHVDAGKSTIGGHLMYITGMVDKRTLEKYEKEAKELNRESWYLSWALDTNIEEREKGKTVEVGRAYFETERKHFTVLDAPGHRSFVPNMISGASQADVAVLVISARKGEFETGFERGGQTREHAMLVKTAGVKHLVILINKMDDPTVEWAEERFKECRDKLLPYLKKVGFNPKTDVHFMPCSGLTGAFLKERPDDSRVSWYSGPTFLDYIDQLPSLSRSADGPVRMPIIDRYKDMGTIVLGKVESGTIALGQKLTLMPNKLSVEVMNVWSDDVDTDVAYAGENVKLKLKNAEEEDVTAGFVLCSPDNLCNTGRIFDAQVAVLEHKSIICSGYSAVLHIHACAEEVTITHLLRTIDKKDGKISETQPRFIKQDQVAIVRLELNGGVICMETFKDFPQMGRFTLRDEGRTVGIGKILKVIQ